MLLSSLQAQHSLNGIVVDGENKALTGVEIFDVQSGELSTSDGDGNFIFDNLSEGVHYFTLFARDYKTSTDSLLIDRDLNHVFRMDALNINLTAIDIAARKEEIFAIKRMDDIEGTSIFAGKKTEVVVLDLVRGNLALNNGRQVYAQIAGLNIYEGNDGGLQLNLGGRGLDPNRTSNFNTRQNGYDISADVLGYPENYYTPPSEAISEIRILRGASSLQYGTQFGGLIDFRLRKIPSFKSVEVISTQTVGSFAAFNSFNYIGANIGKLSVNGFYNYKVGDGYRDNSDYTSHNVHLSIDYRFSDKTTLGLEMTSFYYLAQQAGGLTDHQFQKDARQSTRDRNWFEVDWKLYNLSFKHQLSSSTLISLSVFALDAERHSIGYRGNPIELNENPITALDERDPQGTYVLPRDLIVGNFNNYGAEFRSLTHYKVAKYKSAFLIGGKYYKSNNLSRQGAGSRLGDADFDFYDDVFPDYANQSDFTFPNLNFSLFAENVFYINEKLSITPGLRIEHINTATEGSYRQVVYDNADNPISNIELFDEKIFKRNFVLAGVGLSYKKSNKVQWIANISQNYRSVTFSDIRVVSPTFIIDPNITDEKGLTADVGVRGRLDKVFSYEATLYSVFYNDRIGIILDDRANRVRKNVGNAIIAGSESLVNVNLMRWLSPDNRSFRINMFLNSAFTFSRYIKSEENNVVGKQVEFIPNVNIKSGIRAAYRDLEFSYQFTYLSQQYTDVQNSNAAGLGDNRSGIIGEIPSYHISDLTMTYNYSYLTFNAGVNNLLDRDYFTRRATGYPGPGIIPSDRRSYFVSLTFKL